jgi:prolyl oligopeptidase
MRVTGPVEEVMHNSVVRDPYRWLENRNLPATEEWIRIQQRRCEEYFASCSELSAIERRVRKYLDVEVIDQPACVRDRYFYRKREMGQEQGCIYMREISGANERMLVDPSHEGRFASVGIHRISADGGLLVYEVKRGGEDRKQLRILDVDARATLPNRMPRGYARGMAISHRGYFYCHETGQDLDAHTICYERFGSVEQGSVVFRTPKSKGSRLTLRANDRLLGALWLRPQGPDLVSDLWIAELHDGTPDWVQVFRDKRAPYGPILWHDRILVLAETETGSSRIIELSRRGEERGVFVPEKKVPVQQIAITQDHLFVSYTERGATAIDAWHSSGQRADSVDVPRDGTVRVLLSPAQATDRFFYTFESFDFPPAIYEYSAPNKTPALWHQQGPTDRSRRVDVQETTIRSQDGTEIPLTLVSRKRDGPLVGARPVIMTSYGGFGLATTAQFSVLATVLIELGAVFAVPHIRGGGEFGKAWHDAGRTRNRQASFDDFLAAAQWLSTQGLTTPRQLAIFGGSNSGLLVAVAMTQRPDLFRAVLCIAPLLDMVRYESFDQAVRWNYEYGTVDDRQDFRALYAYSPYHHVAEDVDYPASLFVTGDKDDRCNPAHVRKMAALLQSKSGQKYPVIVDYSGERGHSPVLPLSVRIPALARRIAFLCRELDIAVPQGGCDETTRI